MLDILALYGIPEQIIKAIQVFYTNTTATIYIPDGETQPIDIKAGILQADTLAPFLFILDYILRVSVNQNTDKGLESIQEEVSATRLVILLTQTLQMTLL